VTPEIYAGVNSLSDGVLSRFHLQHQFGLAIGRYHTDESAAWTRRITAPKTGVAFYYTDFGVSHKLGAAISAMPILEFGLFNQNRLRMQAGLGASFHTKKYDFKTNPDNHAISTRINWAFRWYVYYRIFSAKHIDWRIGGGYAHHSNGHTRLRNRGLNSFFLGISADIKTKKANKKISSYQKPLSEHDETKAYAYLESRLGLGQNVLSTTYNHRQPVYAFSAEYGKVYHNTFKVGIGLSYRFYKQYYEYIETGQFLVRKGEEFSRFRDNPFVYASNITLILHGEVLLNHVGIDADIGYNLYKPAYKIDWRLNGGWEDTPKEIPENWILGEYNTIFKLKYRIATRLGLKYYMLGTAKTPPHNFYVAAHINANLGQADFSELSLGYVYSFK